MAKYVIEIPDDKEYAYVEDEKTFLRIPISLGENEIKSISAPTFLRITPYTEVSQETIDLRHARDIENVSKMNYNEGAKDAWEFARKMISTSGNEVSEMWGCATNFGEVMHNTTYSEAKAKYEEWKKQKDDNAIKQKVIELADEIGIHKLYAIVSDIRGE